MADREFVQKVQTAMIAIARDHSVPIALITGEQEGAHLGTGTLVRLRGKPYLLTCDHIARKRTDGSLAAGIGAGRSPIGVINPIQTGDNTNDVAVARLEDNWLTDGRVHPLAASKLAEESVVASDELLFIYGFPTFPQAPSLAATFDANRGLWTSTPAAITRPQHALPPERDPQLHFSIRYSEYEMLPVTSGRGVADPGGLSGSAVWRTGATDENANRWSPGAAQVIGMAIEWHPKHAAIVCLRIEVIRRFLLRALVQEAAYLRWLIRKGPCGDDWADWFAAEWTINQLE